MAVCKWFSERRSCIHWLVFTGWFGFGSRAGFALLCEAEHPPCCSGAQHAARSPPRWLQHLCSVRVPFASEQLCPIPRSYFPCHGKWIKMVRTFKKYMVLKWYRLTASISNELLAQRVWSVLFQPLFWGAALNFPPPMYSASRRTSSWFRSEPQPSVAG